MELKRAQVGLIGIAANCDVTAPEADEPVRTSVRVLVVYLSNTRPLRILRARRAGFRGSTAAQLRFPLRLAVTAARFVPWLVAPDDVRAAGHWWFFDPAKAERELGFRMRPLAETIADTIADDRARVQRG
jgi:hypothetical protein